MTTVGGRSWHGEAALWEAPMKKARCYVCENMVPVVKGRIAPHTVRYTDSSEKARMQTADCAGAGERRDVRP